MWGNLVVLACTAICITCIYLHIGNHLSQNVVSLPATVKEDQMISPFTDVLSLVDHVYYINLDSRPDRRLKVEQELQKCNIPLHRMTRISGVVTRFGSLGCSKAHENALKDAIDKKYGNIMVVEDDFKVLDLQSLHNRLRQFENLNIQWDMLLVSAWILKYELTDVTWLTKTKEAQTTGGYIVHKDYINTYLQNVKEGIMHLEQLEVSQVEYCIDQFWKTLQVQDKWFAFHPPLASQRDDYSDIEHKNVSYHDKAVYVKGKVEPIHYIILSQKQLKSTSTISCWTWRYADQWSVHLDEKTIDVPTDKIDAYHWSMIVQYLYFISHCQGLLYLSDESPHKSMKYWKNELLNNRSHALWGDEVVKDQEWFNEEKLDYPIYQANIPQFKSYVYLSHEIWSELYNMSYLFQHIVSTEGYKQKEQGKKCYKQLPINPLRQISEGALELQKNLHFIHV